MAGLKENHVFDGFADSARAGSVRHASATSAVTESLMEQRLPHSILQGEFENAFS